MPVNKYYYFVEDLDVTDDGIPDGVLVRQVSIKNDFITYHKNMYISENKLIEMLIVDFNTYTYEHLDINWLLLNQYNAKDLILI